MIVQSFLFKRYLDDGEKILAVAHRHFFIIFIPLLRIGFFGVFLAVLMILLFPKLIAIGVIWLIIGGLRILYEIVDWYFDVWLMTNVSVVDIDWKGLFDKTSTRVEYHMIEGVEYKISGFWQTIFNYGDVVIGKMGTGTSVELKDASNPKKVEANVMKYQEKIVKQKSFRDHQALKDLLADMIQHHIQEHGVPEYDDKK